jgi:hypothetical protein
MTKEKIEPKKLKLSVLVNNREILNRLYKTRLDGGRAFRLRKTINRLSEELHTFEAARDDYIRMHGKKTKDGGAKIEPGDSVFSDFLQYVNEMGETEIDAPEPFFSESDLTKLELSVEDIDRISALGLLMEDNNGNK